MAASRELRRRGDRHRAAAAEFTLARANLVRYAGASGDFNPIHWNERFARSVGLPDVIAHGMFTMAQVVRVATDWAGDPGAVIDYGVRFTRPVVVPDDDHGATLRVGGRVIERLEDRCVRVELTASSAAPGQEGDGPRQAAPTPSYACSDLTARP